MEYSTGLEFDAVRFAFSDLKYFNALMEDKGSKADDAQRAKIREQIAILQQADLLVSRNHDAGSGALPPPNGTAILSRYRLDNLRWIPFLVQGHDWYKDEKKRSVAAKAEGKASNALFKEQLIRQARRGGRMMLMADLVDSDLPSGRVTVVATNLED